MIKVIGFRRLLVIGVLIALNVLFAAALYQYLLPQLKQTERKLNSTRSQVSGIQADIERMQIEFEQLDEQQAFFDLLKEDDFFSRQARRDAEEVFLKAETDSGVITSFVNVRSGTLVENEEAGKAEHVMLESPVEIRLEALEDRDIYEYVYILEKLFPGHLSINSMFLERTANLNDTILRGIASGQNPALIKASINMTWRTMVSDDSVDMPEGGGF